MNERKINEVKEVLRQNFSLWLQSCTRGGNISRNTIAIGVVVLDHLIQRAPVSREEVVSSGGEIKGARSKLGSILESYGVPRHYLKEVTTRQAHQDGQRLLEQLRWGEFLASFSEEQRKQLLLELMDILVQHARTWLARQSLKLALDRRQSPANWIHIIVEGAKGRSGGVVEQHLVGAKLQRRFPNVEIPNYPAHAADRQTERPGDFTLGNQSQLVYHVTSAPSRDVLQKCLKNVQLGSHPILLIPKDQEQRARFLAQEENLHEAVTIIAIEDFLALNIIELAAQENKDFFAVLQEIIQIYNNRLSAVETDMSLQIELH